MIIEIHGAGFQNKGAQLMLATAANEIRQRIPDCTFCIAAGRDRPAEAVGREGVHLLWPTFNLASRGKSFPVLFWSSRVAGKLVGSKFLNRYGLISRDQVDAFVDVSGYAFGDAWSVNYLRNTSALAQYYSQRGKPVVFLPQMLGPFTKPVSHEPMRKLIRNSDLVYAREKSSYEELVQLAPSATNIHVAPDITLFKKPAHQNVQPPVFDSNKSQEFAALIPNIRVLDRSMTNWTRPAYVDCLKKVAQQTIESGKNVAILVHETGGADEELAMEIEQSLESKQVRTISSDSPLELKQIIGQARYTVGSRYHSLAASLSMGVPAIAIGWAHKYSELLADFGIPEFDVDSPESSQLIPGRIEQLLNDEYQSQIRQTLAERLRELEVANKNMWEQVEHLLAR